MRLGNSLGSCDRYLKCHSAQAVSYKASRELGNLTDYKVICYSAIVPVTIYCEAIEQCLPNDRLYYVIWQLIDSPRAVVTSSVSETKPSVETSSVNRRIL